METASPSSSSTSCETSIVVSNRHCRRLLSCHHHRILCRRRLRLVTRGVRFRHLDQAGPLASRSGEFDDGDCFDPFDITERSTTRQGVSVLTLSDVDLKDLKTMESVKRYGRSMTEIVLRGSGIMMEYYKDHEATSKVFGNGWFRTGDVGVIHGWFRTGDVGVIHPDGYLEIKDRSKDVIISGGENISSVEVESVLHRHQVFWRLQLWQCLTQGGVRVLVLLCH